MARRRSGKKIDFVHWTGFFESPTALSVGSVGVSLFPAQHDPETLLRMRGEYVCYADGAQAPGGRVAIGSGFILVPEGTGTTVLWSPITDADAPWIWADYATIGYEEMVTDLVDVPALSMVRRIIDNKSMRIIRNQEIQWVIENVTLGTAMTVNLATNGRALFGT